jgi:putative transposase
MPRALRYLMDLGYYHILTRGNDRKQIFRCDADYSRFLDIIKEALEMFQINILNYCLMPNHLHLLIQLLKAKDLPKFMQRILQVYAAYFKKKYDSVGFIFQNRYKSLYINKESYLLECARYIEKNPLRAKIVNSLFEYPWNSFLHYAKGKENSLIRMPNPNYIELSEDQIERQRKFCEFILEEERAYDSIVDNFFRIN